METVTVSQALAVSEAPAVATSAVGGGCISGASVCCARSRQVLFEPVGIFIP